MRAKAGKEKIGESEEEIKKAETEQEEHQLCGLAQN